MERGKSFPEYSSYVKGQYAFEGEEQPKAYSFNGNGDEFASSGNPEMKRKKRVASYKMYAVEGKWKSSLRSSFKWIKTKLTLNNTKYFDA